MSKLMFARNHDLELYRNRSPNEIICGIIDVATNKFYDIDLKSLFHLGAYDINLFTEDLKNEKYRKKIIVLGLPAPGLFIQKFRRFERSEHTEN